MVFPEIDLIVPTGRAAAGVCVAGCWPVWDGDAPARAVLPRKKFRYIAAIKNACLRKSLLQNAITIPRSLIWIL
jgi:hypothetical protein